MSSRIWEITEAAIPFLIPKSQTPESISENNTVSHHCFAMKTTFLFLAVLSLMTLRVSAAATNLNQSVDVELPLKDVIRGMQTYYHDTNYHGNAHASISTNEVAGISYAFIFADCAFHPDVGSLSGEIVASRVTANSTKLVFVVIAGVPTGDDRITASVRERISKTLRDVVKIAEAKR